MRQLQIHARPSDITDEKIASLKTALANHAGDDEVVVVIRSQRLKLGVTADGRSRSARREISLSMGGVCVLDVDLDATDNFG